LIHKMNRRFKLVLLIPTNQPTRFFALRRRKSLISIIKDYRIDKIRWKIQKKKEVIHAHLPVRIPCYDLRLITNRTVMTLFFAREASEVRVSRFGFNLLSTFDGRCEQTWRTYSPQYSWPAITSDSNFM